MFRLSSLKVFPNDNGGFDFYFSDYMASSSITKLRCYYIYYVIKLRVLSILLAFFT
jgi:hypothetical protein